MKAILCKQHGPASKLELAEINDPVPGELEVLIDVQAAGLNFPDTLVIAGKYQFSPDMPFIPGGESSGRIVGLGNGVSGLKPGDRVMSAGMLGAFAEKQCKAAADVIVMPDSMSFEVGAGFLVTYGTSMYALKQCGNLKPGETLVVLGAAGGVGLAAVDIGKAMGARVIAAASSEEKLATALAAGADEGINYSAGSLRDQIKQLTDGKGADVVYDPVGGELTEQALRATGWDGRLLVVGFASGHIPSIPLNLTLLKNNSIKGVFYGVWAQRDPQANTQNIRQLFSWFEQGKLHPLVTQQFQLEEYEEAFATLTERRAKGKVIFRMSS
jgi:NADPH2:quinone reductase